jgi:hypothetical protein
VIEISSDDDDDHGETTPAAKAKGKVSWKGRGARKGGMSNDK